MSESLRLLDRGERGATSSEQSPEVLRAPLSGRAIWGRVVGSLGRLSCFAFLLTVLLFDVSSVGPIGSVVRISSTEDDGTIYVFDDSEAAFGAPVPGGGMKVHYNAGELCLARRLTICVVERVSFMKFFLRRRACRYKRRPIPRSYGLR